MFVDVGSARLFFDVVGASLNADSPDMAQRPKIILLHGGPGYDHSTLRPYFDRYSDTHQLIYLDHRGCGRSSGEQDSWINGLTILQRFAIPLASMHLCSLVSLSGAWWRCITQRGIQQVYQN